MIITTSSSPVYSVLCFIVASTCPLSVKTVEIFMLICWFSVTAVSGDTTYFFYRTTILGCFFLMASTNSNE